ncbi:metal-dependent hydrolase [Leptospira interrogans]
MANFTTHIAVGTIVSGGLATLTLAADVIAPENLIAVTLAGVLGSVLPDIDLKDSRPSRALFSGIAVFLSFIVLFSVAYKYSIAEMWILWLGSFLLFRYGGEAVFHRFSYHRGIWHSVLAGLLFWFLTAIVFKNVLGRHEGVAWLAGGFMFMGYMTHLILDEIYSVDVFDTRLKASFGSAFKLYDPRKVGDSVVIAIITALLFIATPSAKPFVDGIASRDMWAGLQQRLLPEDKWFGFVGAMWLANDAAPAADITTGSITSPAPSEASSGDSAQ